MTFQPLPTCFFANFSHFNQSLTCLLYLSNGLLSVMMQQSCNKALSLVGEELAHMKILENFISVPSATNTTAVN